MPFLTAHRCLTVTEDGPTRLGPGSMDGRTVLVAGGAGAVGNAAIQLARWSDATVITTVSSPEKGHLAACAGADHVIDYRRQDVAAEVRAVAPDGVNTIVEVSPALNAALNAEVLASAGVPAGSAVRGPYRDRVGVPGRDRAPVHRLQPRARPALEDRGAGRAEVACAPSKPGSAGGHHPLDVLEPAWNRPVELQTRRVEGEPGVVEVGCEFVGQDTVSEFGRGCSRDEVSVAGDRSAREG